MLLEFPKGQVCVDKKPVMEDLRINIAGQAHQLRLKFTALPSEGKPVPLDIVVYEYSLPRLEGISTLSITIEGKEMNMAKPFKLKLSFEFLKHRWRVKGAFNGKEIDQTMDHIMEIVGMVRNVV